jgi:hypothetical protein
MRLLLFISSIVPSVSVGYVTIRTGPLANDDNTETLRALGIVPRALSPVLPATPFANVPINPSATPGLGQSLISAQINTPNAGLTCEELIAIIGTYRGHTNGLTGLNEKELMAVLDHYRVSKMLVWP